MTNSRDDSSTARAPRLTTAGRLLREAERTVPLADLARHLRMRVVTLEECRDGLRQLEPERQMKLAAVVLMLAPEHTRLAQKLYGQAQAALRFAVRREVAKGIQREVPQVETPSTR